MPAIPTKLIKGLYQQAKEHPNEMVTKTHWCMKYITNWNERVGEQLPIVQLFHYDTLILTVGVSCCIVSSDSWSCSDRDGINSLLCCMGLDCYWICRKKGENLDIYCKICN